MKRVLFASIILSVSATAAPTPITPAQLGASHVTFSASGDLSANPSPGAFGYAFPYLICPPEIGGFGGALPADVTRPRRRGLRHDPTVWCWGAPPGRKWGLSHDAQNGRLNKTVAL